ncbi:MAG: membrane biogenesis protein [Mongoliibacter sp.]|uniref:AsmA-like C-terminal region-containing protein n=1 Tax=Mongoliibacter sp. TaxID=2022438 RepID=UPI0012F38C76|nr:AsmA-like C-terminal region-containing protein [Mongoliibacter sp.]TVP46392.1 MAG: membrane biogenesis protein [Mongoliibacter sp.]
MKSWVKTTILTSIAFTLILLGVTVALLAFHQDSITQKALNAANKQFEGKLTVEKSRISLFKEFPYISIDLRNIKFYENKSLNTKPFYEADHLYLGFNIWDIWEGKYKVKSIRITDGHIDIVRYPNRDINILLAKGLKVKEQETQSEPIGFELNKVKISNVALSYFDLSDSISYTLRIDHWQNSIKKQEKIIDFNLKTDVTFDLFKNGKQTFFSEKHINLDLDLSFDSNIQVLTLKPSHIELENALFAGNGNISILENGLDLDLKLEGQKPDFNMFSAFLPLGVASVLNEYQNEGDVFFKGSVKGLLGDGSTPLITAEFGCENAFFQRMDNNLKVDNLRFSGFFTNGEERNIKTSELRVQNFNARPDQGIFQGELTIRNFEDPFIKVKLKADVDLGFVGDFFQLDQFEGVKGKVLLSMDFDELVDLDASEPDFAKLKESVQSELILKDLEFSLTDFEQPIRNVNAYAVMREGVLSLSALNFQIEDSDYQFKGEISDLPALFHRFDKPVRLTIETNSKTIDLAQLSKEKKEKIHDFSTVIHLDFNPASLSDYQHIPQGMLEVVGLNATLEHYPHSFENFNAKFTIDEHTVVIQNLSGKIDQSDFLLNATLHNYPKWFEKELAGMSSIDWSLKSSKLKMNDLLTFNGINYLPESWSEEVFSALDLEGKINIYFRNGLHSAELLLAKLTGRTQFHSLKLEEFRGMAKWEENYLSINEFGGKMGLSEFSFDLGLNLKDNLSTKKDFFNFRADALDLDALMDFKGFENETNHAEAFNIFKLPFRNMEYFADIQKLNYHKNWLDNVKVKARSESNHMFHLDTLNFNVAQGSLGIKGYLNGSNPEEIYMNAEIKANRLDLDHLLFKLESSGKDIMINENLKGSVSGSITGNFLVYPDLTPIINKSDAKLDLTVYDGTLIGFAPFLALSDFFSDRNLNMVRFDTLTNTFDLKDGVLQIPRMNINSSLGFVEISGKQSLDLNMDYQIRIPLNLVTQVGFRSLFGGRSRNEINPEQEDAIVFRNTDRRVRFLNINVQGRPDDYRISLGRAR